MMAATSLGETEGEFSMGQAINSYTVQDGSVIQNEVQEVGFTSNQLNQTARHADTEDNIQETKQKPSVSNYPDKTDSIEDLGDEWPSYETGSNILPPLVKPKFDGFKNKEACIDSALEDDEDDLVTSNSLVKADIKPGIKTLNQSASNNLTHQTASTQGTAYLPVTISSASDLYSPGCSFWSDYDETDSEDDEMTTSTNFLANQKTGLTTMVYAAVTSTVLPENATEIISSATSITSCTQDSAHLNASYSRKRKIETSETQEEHENTSKKMKWGSKRRRNAAKRQIQDTTEDQVEQQESPGNSSTELVSLPTDLDDEARVIEELLCLACFNTCSPDKSVKCNNRHVICKGCLKVEICCVITSDKVNLSCPVTLCNAEITLDALLSLQTSVTIAILMDKLYRKQSEASLKAIQQLDGLVSCPRCQFAAILDDDVNIFHCINGDCNVKCCRYCKAPWLQKQENYHVGCSLLKFSGSKCLDDISMLPDNWTSLEYTFQQEYGYESVTVPLTSEEGIQVCQLYSKTSLNVVVELKRIHNRALWEKYVLKRKHMKEEIGEEELREKFLYHGTENENIDKICREGFDCRKASVNGTTLGKGNYFSTTASYSETFALGKNYLFLVRVLTGKSAQGQSNNTHPPYQKSGRMFDSCVNIPSQPCMYVVYSNEQCYPAYVIEFNSKVN